MSPSKISPFIPLVLGVVFIAAALVGTLASMTRDEPAARVAGKAGAAAAPTREETRPAAESREDSKADSAEELSEEELRRQTIRILLERIAETPDRLDADWLARVHQYVRTPAELEAFFAEYMALGQKRARLLQRAQRHAKKLLPQDPRYFVSQADGALVARDPSEASLLKGVRENMALALYKKQEEEEGLENVAEEFMGTFFRNIHSMYEALEKMAIAKKGNADKWTRERVRALEAAVMDRHLRVERRKELARAKKEGTGQSIAAELFRTDRLEKAINENLLELGHVYYEAAEREVADRKKHRFYADQAFKVLAMVYQRSHSGEALDLMRAVNDIQREYLHRLARISWKRAQLAVAAGEVEQAREHYFTATQRYLQCMAQSVEPQRQKMAREFRILKKEIAEWNAGRRAAASRG